MVGFQDVFGVSIFVHTLEGEKHMTYKQSHFEGEKLGSWEITMEATRNQNDFYSHFSEEGRQHLRIGSM